MKLHLYQFNYSFPFQSDPEWSSKVDRWYQLDAEAYGLTELVWRIEEKPDLIFLASQEASNSSDRLFIESEMTSAVKFAHTLPNVRCSPFLQAKQWTMPVLCTQFGPKTFSSAVENAFGFLGSPYRRILILNVCRSLPSNESGTSRYSAYALQIDDASQGGGEEISIADLGHNVFNGSDQKFIENVSKVLCKKEAFTLIEAPSL